MKPEKNAGFLFIFQKKEDKKEKKLHLFLRTRGIEDDEASLIVIEGIKNAIDTRYKNKLSYNMEFINTEETISLNFPDVKETHYSSFPLSIFYDEENRKFEEYIFALGIRNLLKGGDAFFPDILTGAIARGTNLFNREDEIEKTWEAIEAGKNIFLQAPRRYGKSTILYSLIDAPKKRYLIKYFDLENLVSPQEFIIAVAFAFGKNDELKKKLETLLDIKLKFQGETDEMKKRMTLISELDLSWEDMGERIFNTIAKCSLTPVILLDEFPVMLDNFLGKKSEAEREKVNKFIDWFKNIIDEYRSNRFVIAGSINLPLFLKNEGLKGNFGDFHTILLKPLNKEKALFMIKAILYGRGIFIEKKTAKQILKYVLPGIPYFLNIFLSEIVQFTKEKGETPESELIEKIYYSRVVGPDCRRHLDYFVYHLSRYGAAREPIARRVLSPLCTKPQGKMDFEKLKRGFPGQERELDAVLENLTYDFYLERFNNEITFANGILRDYWLIHHCRG